MPTRNPYEDIGLDLNLDEPIVPKGPGEAENPYEAIADSMLAQDKNDLRANLMAEHTPDQAAKALRLAPGQPFPREFTLRNVDEIGKQESLKIDLDALKDAPLTADAMRKDPIIAAAAKGDIPRLREIEQLLAPRITGEVALRAAAQYPRAFVQEGVQVAGEAALRLGGMAVDFLDEATGGGMVPEEYGGPGPYANAADTLRRAADRSAESREFFRPTPRNIFERGLYAGGVSGPVSLLATGAGAATRGAAGQKAAASALVGGAVELGQRYGEERASGRGRGEALLRALPSSVSEALTELLPDRQFFKALEKAGGIGLPDFIKNALFENVQEGVNFGVQTADALLQGRTTLPRVQATLGGDLAELAIATTAGASVQVGIARAAQSAQMRISRNAGQIADAQAANTTITKLMEAAKNIKLREAAPTELAKLVQTFAGSNPDTPSNLFVDAEDLQQVFEQSGMTEEQLAAALPSLRAQGVDLHAGGTVALPLGELTAGLPGSPLEKLLVPHLRATEDGMSAAQAEEAAKAAEEFVQKEAENVIKSAEDAQAMQASAETVFTTMREQIAATGRFQGDVADNYAGLVRDFYTAMSARIPGETPESLYQKYPYRVVAADTAAPQAGELNQNPRGGQAHPAALPPMTFRHYSKVAGLSTLSADKYGTGLIGAEKDRLKYAKDARIKRRVYFYPEDSDGFEHPEGGLGPNKNDVVLSNMYDGGKDPLGINKALKAQGLRGDDLGDAFESAVIDAGFAGYRTADMAVVLDADVQLAQTFEQARYTPEQMELLGGAGSTVDAVRSLALDDAFFASPKSTEKTLAGVMKTVAPYFKVAKNPDLSGYGQTAYEITGRTKSGETIGPAVVTVDSTDGTVQLDIAAFKAGQRGNAVYQAVGDFAHNNGLVFIGDTGGLSPLAQVRRAENMLSSALRWGTTRHLGGHELMEDSQVAGVVPLDWKPGDDEHNIRRLITVTRTNTRALAPEIMGMRYNFEASRFEHDDGTEATDADFRAIAEGARGRTLVIHRQPGAVGYRTPVGRRTLKRAVLFDSLLRREGESDGGGDGGRNGLLARLGGDGAESVLSPALQGLFYATAEGGPKGTFNPKTLTATLLKTADRTTFLHETSHFFLTVLADVAAQPNAPADVVADMATVLKSFGVPDLATWSGMSVDQQRKHHEDFAGAWEQYIFTGKAPSLGLRGALQRFSQFAKQAYGSLKALVAQRGGTLSPDISGVFDRLIATEQAIKEAEQVASMEPLFGDAEAAKAAGITAEEFENLQRVMAQAEEAALSELQARSLRDLRWVLRTQDKAFKAVAKDVKQKRDAIKEEVTAEVKAMPVYAALRWFRTGVLADGTKTRGARLYTRELKDIFGTEEDAPWRQLPFAILSSKVELTVPVAAAAEMFGFGPTGDEAFVRALAAAPSEAQMVDALTDQRLLETYGDITSKSIMERAANEAVFNEARARAVASEYKALTKASSTTETTAAGGRVNVVMRAAKQFAERLIAEQAVRDIKPLRHTAAASRAAKRTAELQAKGDTAGAIKAKRDQLLQTYAAREAYDAQHEIDSAVAYLKKFDKVDANKRIDQDYLDQIHALLEQFDLRKGTTRKEAARRKSLLAWVEQQRERGHEPVIDPDVLAAAGRTPYLDLSLEEFRNVVDAVRNIEHLGRRWKTLLTAKDNREFDATVKEITDTIRANATQTYDPRLVASTTMDDLKDWFKSFVASHRKFSSIVQQLDGLNNRAGPLWQALVRPMNERSAWEQARMNSESEKLAQLLKPMFGRKARRKALIPSLGIDMPLETRIVAALNWGNADNRQRMMAGDGWNAQNVGEILGTLTAEELGVVNQVWAYLEGFWPEIAAKEKRVTGVEPERVEATPFQVKSADGQTVDMTGGYYPIKYDMLRSGMAEAHDKAAEAKAMMQGAYTRATTRRGHTKSRAEAVSGRPLDKNITTLFTHTQQVVHDLAWHEWLIDANRLLSPRGALQGVIRDTVGPFLMRELTDTLQDIAGGNTEAATAVERGMSWVRTGATVATMGLNLTTAALQPLGLTQSMVRIGPRWVAAGMGKWLGSAAHMENVTKEIYAKSPLMADRARTFHAGVAEVRNTARGRKSKARSNVELSYFWFIAKMQQVADIPTWLGQYEKTFTETADEALAVAQADQAVIDAQTSATVENLARIQRGGPYQRLFTNFMSYFSGTYNLMLESWHRNNLRNPAQFGRFVADMMLLTVVPATLSALLRMALKGDPPEDEEELVKTLAVENATYMMGMIFGVRELSSAVAGFGGYSGPAGTRVFDDLSKLYGQVQQGEVDEALVTSAVGSAGVLFHFPSGQLNRLITGYLAASEGDAPPTAMLFGKPRKD